ncbi:DUF3782 domain-containing protein [uncultured Thiohalocapsa sp.]|uniref:PD-(D/E)XK nuclease family protein n=1 Tax=uncultured Thiohalocapsa sp. TaxID=768990 RepID=UPI0025D2A335|nr:DUF3782 domain-containing protein [uncultured Thiohalocapsa sp.]
MSVEEIKAKLQAELPELLRQDAGFRAWLEDLIRSTAVSVESFDARFDRVLREFAAEREEQARKWDEQKRADQERQEAQNRKWDEQKRADQERQEAHNRKWDEQKRADQERWEEQNRKWHEQHRADQERWEEQNRKWHEQHRADQERQEEQNRKWHEQHQLNMKTLEEIRKSRVRQEQVIGALGARWGLASEASFRAALKGILEESFGVEVINVNEFDDEGTVFGVPDQVEIDIIVRNGELILCELKSSMSKADIYTFERKVQYYQRRHGRTASRKIVISPMVRPEARPVAERLGIEVFGSADEVPVS